MTTQAQKAQQYGLTRPQFTLLKKVGETTIWPERGPEFSVRVMNALIEKNLVYVHVSGFYETTRKGDVTLNSIKEA